MFLTKEKQDLQLNYGHKYRFIKFHRIDPGSMGQSCRKWPLNIRLGGANCCYESHLGNRSFRNWVLLSNSNEKTRNFK